MGKCIKGKRGWVPRETWGMTVNVLYSHKAVNDWRKKNSFSGIYLKNKCEIVLYSENDTEFFILKGTGSDFNRISKVIDNEMTLEEAINAIQNDGILNLSSIYSRLKWALVNKADPENNYLRALWLTV